MARVWIYQSNRILTSVEVSFIRQELDLFLSEWNAHGAALTAQADIRYNLFIIITVDESKTLPSGCSIDKSVYLLKSIEEKLHISLFDRFQLAYRNEEGIQIVNRSTFESYYQQGLISDETIVFNNLVSNDLELMERWEVPLNRSWHYQFFK